MTTEGEPELKWQDVKDMQKEIEEHNARSKGKIEIELTETQAHIYSLISYYEKTEVEIFNLKQSLKLSQELNASYEKLIKNQNTEIVVFKEIIEKYQKFIHDNVPTKTAIWIDEK